MDAYESLRENLSSLGLTAYSRLRIRGISVTRLSVSRRCTVF